MEQGLGDERGEKFPSLPELPAWCRSVFPDHGAGDEPARGSGHGEERREEHAAEPRVAPLTRGARGGLDARILELLWRIAGEGEVEVDGLVWEDSEIRLGQYKVLSAVASEPGFMTVDRVATKLRCSKANVGPILKRLVGDDRLIVRRVPGRPTRLVYQATDQGVTTREACEMVVRDYAKDIFADLDDGERLKLASMLARVVETSAKRKGR